MASSPSFPTSLASFFVPLPVVSVGLKFLILGTVLSSFLIPAAVVLFFFSTPRLRRQPIFIFNAIAIVFGLIQGIINVINAIRPMLNQPEIPIARSTLAISLYVVVPLCVESVLILRVITVYPPRLLSLSRCLALYGPIVLMKVARVTNATYFIYLLLEGPRAQDALSLAESVWHMPSAKVEWLIQLVDDTYVSGLFLYRIHTGTRGLIGRPPLDGERIQGIDPTARANPYLERLKTLFWIAASNFVFPVLLNVAQLVLILHDADFERGILVLVVNNYVTIIGVLLATIWASGSGAHERASARWTKIPDPGSLSGEKRARATFSRRSRPRSAPPTRSVGVVSARESMEVLPATTV